MSNCVNNNYWKTYVKSPSTHEKILSTFNKTGCRVKNTYTYWWSTQTKSTALEDMYAYCNLVNNGKANYVQKIKCCGNNRKCGKGKLKCEKQIDWVSFDEINKKRKL